MKPLSPRVRAWADRGAAVEFRGRRIHVFERGGAQPTLLFLHGFPSSSFDWRGVLDALGEQAAVAFDCLGFGLSDKPRDHDYRLGWQADLAQEIVARAGGPAVVLVAHDMGTSVATELLARDIRGETPLDIRGALLFNGSIIVERASLTIGQKLLRSPAGPLFARLTNEPSFRRQFARLFSAEHPLTRDEAADQYALIECGGGRRVMAQLTDYIGERIALADRWHGAVRDWPGELHLAWGLQDPVATTNVLDGLVELRPGAPVSRWPDLGHYPALEDPARVAHAVRGLLDAVARPANMPRP